MQVKYQIFRLSAKSLMGYAENSGRTTFEYRYKLSRSQTDKCKIYTATHEQEDNALFFQIMCQLHGEDFKTPTDKKFITDLSDIICIVDFEGIFDRNSSSQKYADMQNKAKSMFSETGIGLDLGAGYYRYFPFERSASMSRKSQLTFIRNDFYYPVRRRIMMGMELETCQLSKLYAYNGLMLSSGKRVDNINIDKLHRVIVVDNPEYTLKDVPVITVKDVTGEGDVRKYERVETVVLLSHKKPDGHINVKVEFGEGEGKVPLDNIAKRAESYKPKERVTYKMIKEYIEAKYGFKVHTAYIAEVKRDLGLPMYDAPNVVEELKQPRKHPTAEKVEAIKDALKHFEVI